MAASVQQRPVTGIRTAILASADLSFRQRVRDALTELRWQVREAGGGAETLACLDAAPAEAVVVDSWLPDLEVQEFVAEFERLHPGVDLVMADATGSGRSARSPRRNEVLHALRRAQAGDEAAWNAAPGSLHQAKAAAGVAAESLDNARNLPESSVASGEAGEEADRWSAPGNATWRLPEFVGSHPALLEVSRRIRLVAPRSTAVLIEGPTGSGKELVAQAVHRLSPRAARRMVALNCAAIPEALLEAELFGHTRGAFTGAVQGRTGRIEAAHGGTLFLDEIGEMPLALQAKLLRFLETGELQRVGDNEPVKVDVRIVAAAHQPLQKLAARGEFREDLYYRLSVASPDVASRDVASQAVASRATIETAAVREAPQVSEQTKEKNVAAENGAGFAGAYSNSGAAAGSSGVAAGVEGRFSVARSGGGRETKPETKPVPEKAAAAGSAMEMATRAPAGQTEATMPVQAQAVPIVGTAAPNLPEDAAVTQEKFETPQETSENPAAIAAPASMEKAVGMRDLPAHGRAAQPRISGRVQGKASAKATGVATKNDAAAMRPEGIVDGQKPVAVQPFSCPIAEPHTMTPAHGPMAATAARSAGEAARVPGSAERMAVPSETPGNAPKAAVRSNSTAAEQQAAMAAETPVAGQRTVAGAAVSSPAAMPAHGMQQLSSAPVTISLPTRMSGAAAHAAPPSPGATFERIDSGAAPQMLNRTPQRLEVGVHDPGLGWVEVRARAAEGQIAATVSTSSTTHPAVAAQLPAMREYLAGQQVRVDTLNAQPFEAGADGGRNASGNRNPNGNPPAASAKGLSDFSGEAEPESLSWIDVRV